MSRNWKSFAWGVLAGALLALAVGAVFCRRPARPEVAPAAAAELTQLATRALHRLGVEDRAAFVTLGEKLPDGSHRVLVTLSGGRAVRGRLWRDRERERIELDPASLFGRETTIRIEPGS